MCPRTHLYHRMFYEYSLRDQFVIDSTDATMATRSCFEWFAPNSPPHAQFSPVRQHVTFRTRKHAKMTHLPDALFFTPSACPSGLQLLLASLHTVSEALHVFVSIVPPRTPTTDHNFLALHPSRKLVMRTMREPVVVSHNATRCRICTRAFFG